MYYLGWKKTVSVPYAWAIGLAISRDNGKTFERVGDGPIMNVSYDDPYLLAAPRSVFQERGIWHMYYPSGTGWITDDFGRKESVYLNRHAVSPDGISWKKDSGYCVETVYEDESQGGGCIIMEDNIYHMFFSYRHSIDFRNGTRGYSIGYARSRDLMTWKRDDAKAGIKLSEDGWDSEMICYPHVIKIGEQWVMFYCGNAFGQGGLGYASLEETDLC